MEKFVAIDTGFRQGGILFWDSGPVFWYAISKLDWTELKDQLCEFNAPIFMEEVIISHLHGKKTLKSNGRGFGRLEMLFILCNLEYHLVHPKTWQKQLGIQREGRDYRQHKNYLFNLAEEYFPGLDFSKEVADAFLIGKYVSEVSSLS